jgi:hypothetical protein
MDEAWWNHNKPKDYAFGKAVFERRKASCFGHPELVKGSNHDANRGGDRAESDSPIDRPELPKESRVLAFCFPGENFSSEWVSQNAISLLFHIASRGFQIAPVPGYTTNVYMTRQAMAQKILECEPKANLVLWVDDDNLLTPDQFDMLLNTLDTKPDVTGVTGWCWIQFEADKRFVPSCGDFMPDGVHLKSLDGFKFQSATELREIEWTGFPCFLMRREALEKAGFNPFIPILDERLESGMSGEDSAFCLRARAAGCKFLVDPRVHVPHLKRRAIEPEWILAPQAEKEPVIVGMVRAKNEARWIERSVKSLLRTCARVFVMDDSSTDNTRELAEAVGATVLCSPFEDGPNEGRDKNWMMERIQEQLKPDWFFCIDGDEEVEPGTDAKILAAVRHPGAPCYGFKFYQLWDKPDQIRVDRWYSDFVRQCLFRPVNGFKFRSIYENRGVAVHAGLHTGNAPGDLRTALLEGVRLIHYGYMERENRIRKFKYYNALDPHNSFEDGYRHCVQGDIPEVPRDAVLKHAGPLELKPLPLSVRIALGTTHSFQEDELMV